MSEITLNQVIGIAIRAHEGQYRRDGVTPYIKHPREVANRVLGDDLAEMTAWLHDVLEDTSVTARDLREAGVPEQVVEAVELLTFPKGKPYMTQLAKIKHHDTARKVKIADMLSNLADSPTERQIRKYASGLLFLLE